MYIVVNADDVGYSQRRDEGIFRSLAHRDGIVTSVSLLVNGASAKEASEQLLSMPNIDVGLHLNITEGLPVASPAEVSSLLQNGFFRGKMEFRQALYGGEIKLDEVKGFPHAFSGNLQFFLFDLIDE